MGVIRLGVIQCPGAVYALALPIGARFILGSVRGCLEKLPVFGITPACAGNGYGWPRV